MAKRFVYYVDESMYETSLGFRPVIVFEGESGYHLQGGGDIQPWYWGHDIDIAREIAQERNQGMGISAEEADKIVGRSMFPVPT